MKEKKHTLKEDVYSLWHAVRFLHGGDEHAQAAMKKMTRLGFGEVSLLRVGSVGQVKDQGYSVIDIEEKLKEKDVTLADLGQVLIAQLEQLIIKMNNALQNYLLHPEDIQTPTPLCDRVFMLWFALKELSGKEPHITSEIFIDNTVTTEELIKFGRFERKNELYLNNRQEIERIGSILITMLRNEVDTYQQFLW